MSVPITGYRGTQVFTTGAMQDIGLADATYADYLALMGGDVAATLAWLKDLAITPPGIPTPSVSVPLNQTQSVVQDPVLQPAQANVYQIYISPFFIAGFGPISILASNEVTTGLQPYFILWMKGSSKWIKITQAQGTNGVASVSGIFLTQGGTYKITATNLIVGKSKVTWYQGTPPVLAAPTITRWPSVTGNTVVISHALTAQNAPKIQWRKKNSDWVWQPYSGPFTKPSGSYTLEARALKIGYNDTNATAESIIA